MNRGDSAEFGMPFEVGKFFLGGNISRLRVVFIAVGIVALLFLGSYLASLYADLLWYQNLGFDAVFIICLLSGYRISQILLLIGRMSHCFFIDCSSIYH